MTDTEHHTTPEDALASLWAEGSHHSLCAQEPGTPFRTVGFYDNPEDLMAAARQLASSNVWWGVNATTPQRKGRGGDTDIVSVCALHADYDWHDNEAHSDADLPDELKVRAAVDTMVPAPTHIIESGHGFNLHWNLSEVLDPAEGKQLSDGFFRYMEATYDLKNDRTDMASILRVPGTYNHKSEPVMEVIVARADNDGYDPAHISDNYWLPEPETPRPIQIEANEAFKAPATITARYDNDETPVEFMKRNHNVHNWLQRQGWQAGTIRGEEEQMTRPGKDARHGTSATMHHDTNIVNIYTTTIDPTWAGIGHQSQTVLTLNGFDAWMIENGYNNVSDASRAIRQLMPTKTRPPAQTSANETGPGDETADHDSTANLNLPDTFWETRDTLAHIKQAAWARSCSPDAVLAGVIARYSASLPPQIKLPLDGTLDVFFVVQGHSGAGKSKAGKTARAVTNLENIKGVMMDRNVGSGEGLAEAFFEWLDEDDRPCGPNKKGARKVRTRHGLHFSTDEGAALQASAGRANSILIPTLCAAWMGEPIGQLLADPTKSRMIDPMTVRVSAEIRIQTAHGWKLFDEAFASTGLSQRMVCVSAIDPQIAHNYQTGKTPPEWPGPLNLPRPTIVGGERVLTYCPAIQNLLAQEAAAVHDPTWVGSPLDTHRTLSAIKIAAILALWENRTEISQQDFDIASQILDTHTANRTILKASQTEARRIARETKVTHTAEQEVAVMNAKEAEMLGKTVAFLRDKIRAGKYPLKRNLSAAKRAYYAEARTKLEDEGIWPEPTGNNPTGL